MSLTRFACNTGLLDRPLTIGLLWGALTGEWTTAAGVSIFFELFWLDLFPAGTYIPPHGALSVFLCLSVSHLLGLSAAHQVFPVMILSLPLAWFGSRLEHWQRTFQNKSYNQLIQWSREEWSSFRPKILVKRSMLQIGLVNLALFMVAAVLLVALLQDTPQVGRLMPSWVSWPLLWMVASIGGVLSLRIKRAHVLLGIGICCIGALIWLTGG